MEVDTGQGNPAALEQHAFKVVYIVFSGNGQFARQCGICYKLYRDHEVR